MRDAIVIALAALLLSACAKDDISPVDAEKQAFEDLRTEMQTAIVDPGRADEAIQIVNQLESDLVSLRASVRERRDTVRRLNTDYDTTREEFEAFLAGVEAEVQANKKRVSESHRALLALITPEERSAVAKAHTRAMNAAITTIQTI